MIRRLIVLIVAVCTANAISAQRDMAKLLIEMPDSVVNYLNQSKRTELVDFYNMGVKAQTMNLLYCVTTLDSISDNYADIRLSESARMQIQILEEFNGDSVICVAKTVFGQEPETELAFYSTQWEPLQTDNFIDSIEQHELMAKPDTMNAEDYSRLEALIDPVMFEAEIIPQDFAIQFSLATPFVSNDDKERLKSILKSRKVKWDGERFK